MNTKQRGELTEAQVIPRLMKKGYAVSKPVSENSRYDLILDCPDKQTVERAQVKTGWLRDDEEVIEFKTAVTRANNNGNYAKKYEKSDIDCFIVWSPDVEDMFKVDIQEAPKGGRMYIRLEKGQRGGSHINWADDYRI